MREWMKPGSVLLLVASLAGCREQSGLTGTHGSPEALAQAVLDALAERDRSALEALIVTRAEHQDLLWDQLPESGNTPLEFVWQLNNDNSREARKSALTEYGGERLELVDLRFTETPEIYSTFTLHFGARMSVRRSSDGVEGMLPLMGVVVEHQGHWKVLNFVD